jgi:hypothetical protein
MRSHPEIKPAAWGAIAGAVALAIVGFSWGGWMLGGPAERMAQARADTAVVTALTPICIAKFRAQADAAAKLTELKKASTWEQGSYIEKGGWATIPGTDAPSTAVARACAEQLGKVT